MMDAVTTVSRDQLIGALRRQAVVLLDVLSPESFAAAHIPGAINLPVADMSRRVREVLSNRDAPVVVYCGGPT